MEKVPELGKIEKFQFPPKKCKDNVINMKCHLPRHDIFYYTVIFFPIPTLNLPGENSDLVLFVQRIFYKFLEQGESARRLVWCAVLDKHPSLLVYQMTFDLSPRVP